jgi:hypothetical protein
MSEMTLLYILKWASAFAFVLPLIAFAYTFIRDVFSSSFVIVDDNGHVLGQITAETVQRDPKELEELQRRIRQSGHVNIRAAA